MFAEDAHAEKEVTLRLFEQLGNYQLFVSEIVMAELNRAPENLRKKLFDLVGNFNFEELSFTEEAKVLSDKYITEGVIPLKYQEDAFHIAIASVNDMDAIISWNFKHIMKLKTKREVVGINLLMGYKAIDIYSPWEVVDES